MGTAGSLVIQRSTNNGTDWTTVDTRKAAVPSTDYSDTSTYTQVDIGGCLINGSQKIRIRAYFTYQNENGESKTMTSTYVIVGNTITKTTLSLTQQRSWQTPIYASAFKTQGFPLNFMVYGAVAKTLHVVITGGNNTVMPELTYPLTASDDSASISKYVTDSTDTYKLFDHGVRIVKAWLTCDDGMGGTIKSDILENSFMVVNSETTGADLTKPYIMVQNLLKEVGNYTQVKLCEYAVFSPKNTDGNITNDGDPVDVTFYITDYSENFVSTPPTEYFRFEQKVEPGVPQTLNATIELEAGDDAGNTLTAYFRIWRKGSDGKMYNFLQESQNSDNISISVDNSESFSPKTGASFLLNPKTRNNSEDMPARITNARNGNAEVESTWTNFGFITDGWVMAEDGVKVLRILSGSKLNIKYNPFKQFRITPDSAMTLEIDFSVRKITNEEDSIISISELVGGVLRGLVIKPMRGNIYTKSNTIDSETDFSWSEDTRTRLTINIHNAVSPNKGDVHVPTGFNTTKTKIALVRVYINGDKERELEYSITDNEEFCTGDMSNGGITLGTDGANLDIYSIRCYENTAVEETEVVQNVTSTLPTTAEKLAMRTRNDILTAGKVDIEKVKKLGRNCLVWHGTEPYHENTSQQLGWWEIFRYDEKGNYLPEFSGSLCKETKSLSFKRQGSTANTYFDSNGQTDQSKVKATVTVPLTNIHSSIHWELKTVTLADGTSSQVVSMYGGNLGKNFPVEETAIDYQYDAATSSVIVPDGWVDGNGKYRGICYQLAEGTPLAQKLVNKINYASSMQSHLAGINNLYNDLHTMIVGKNSLQQVCATARVSKYTVPFYYFMQEEENGTPLYRGGSTFGAGKMDKPTWGYVKALHPMFCMIEGSDNNYELTDMRVPFTWNATECSENVTYSADDEGFFYNGKQCIDYDAGATESDGTPKAAVIKVIQDTWNFLFLHAPNIDYYKGTFDAFQTSDAAKNTHKKYWCTEGTDAYILKRYDFVDSKWVDAGLWDSSAKAFSKIDLRTDSMTAATYTASSNKSQYVDLNKELQAAVVGHAKKYIGFYFRVDSLRFNYAFNIHLMAGTDSCSKNTYYTLDPKAVSVTIDGETRTCYLFEMHSDDIDTSMVIDNNGRGTKKYYIDRMHPYNDEDQSTSKYEGMQNVLFNLCEQMWENTKELQSMLKAIFTVMVTLVKETDYIEGWTDNMKVSVWGCLYKYVFFIQHYFSEMAYNEQGRIRYEYPHMIGFISSGSGARQIDPITQSNGSLLQAELQFMRRRLVYMASYAAWGNFYDGGKSASIGLPDATSSFSMQAFHKPGEATSENTYKFTLTPHQYIYPTGMMGQTSIDPHVRVAPGQQFELNLGTTTSNDTGVSILGVNYYRSLGNMGNLSTTPANTLTVNGKRLTEFIAEPTDTYTENGVQVPAFRPGQVKISATELKKFSLKGCKQIGGALDASNLTRLEELDVRQTSISDVSIPETNVLKKLRLPATITAVKIVNNSALETLEVEGYSNIKTFQIKNNLHVDTYEQGVNLYKANPSGLKDVALYAINFPSCTCDMLMWYASKKADLTGRITMVSVSNDRYLLLADKQVLCVLYGNIDSESNSLYINYAKRAINKVAISGKTFITDLGNYQFGIVPSPSSGNNVAIVGNKLAIGWKIADTAAPYAKWTDDVNGVLDVLKLSDAALDLKHEITVDLTLSDGTKVSASKKVGFYRHIPKVEDFAYADGTYDSDYDTTREVVGQVFMRTPIYGTDGTTLIGYNVRVYSVEDLKLVTTDQASTYTTFRFGLYPDNNNGHLSAEQAIKDATGLTSVFDIPTIVNITSRWNGGNPSDGGTVNGVSYDCVDDGSYLDANRDDGYKVLPATGAAASDYSGKKKTALIIEHAKKIIGDYLGKSWPTSSQELVDAMQAIIAENSTATSPWRYEEFYYPAVFGCYLYQPKVEGTLADQYKSTKWYCPAEGELARLYNFFRLGVDIANAKTDAANEATTPIMANANAKVGGVLFNFIKNWYWSVSESDANYSWILYFSSGYLYNIYNKCHDYYVRPCTAFDFLL
jgi:hypothetical protein